MTIKLHVVENFEDETPAVFSLVKDGEDVNVLCNGEVVIYFTLEGEKITLEHTHLNGIVRLFNVDSRNRVVVH
jgi:hypothetical protein